MKIYFLIGAIAIFCFGCNNKNSQREMITLRTLDIALQAIKKQNNINIMSVQHEYLGGLPKHLNKYYDAIKKVNSYSISFDNFISKTKDISLIQDKYIQTVDSLSKFIVFCAFDTLISKYKSIADSTLNYFNKNEKILIKKMQFDIYSISYEITYALYTNTFCAVDYIVSTEVHPLFDNYKDGDKYVGLVQRPGYAEYEEGVIIDSIKFNKKHDISFKLYESVAVIRFDSVLKKGNYSINGKLVYQYYKMDGLAPHKIFEIKPIKDNLTVK